MGKNHDSFGRVQSPVGLCVSVEGDLTPGRVWRSKCETPDTSWDQQKQTQSLLTGMFPQPRGSRPSSEEREKVNMKKDTFLNKKLLMLSKRL